ncbi:MAG: phosphoribosylamine--glycine ligase [Candidatus Gracilibacteria bacterium]|nr:phosphoribosylamine--glycine ligase [Candidatus Gracilibacteria bacterium]
MKTNVLVLGNGGREHAICTALTRSKQLGTLWTLGTAVNPGIESLGAKIGLTDSLEDFEKLGRILEIGKIDLVIPGPEAPLAAGVTDFCWRNGVACFGPTKEGAQLESSKSWTRDLLQKHGVGDACPDYLISTKRDDPTRKKFFEKWDGQIVVKADGLLGGKGVIVAGDHFKTLEEAEDFAKQSVEQFGRVVLEEKLIGVEFSLISLVDGKTVLDCRACQDHKRVFENDTGPQTGGMGVISDERGKLPFLTEEDLERAHDINVRSMKAVEAETGQKFLGVLYGGFIATKSGVQLIEYNVRFGDPEGLNILATLESDLVEVCRLACEGNLDKVGMLQFAPVATVQKYLCAPGYPEDPQKGGMIKLPEVLNDDTVQTFFAGIKKESGTFKISGGRSIGVVGLGKNLDEANANCEKQIARLEGEFHYRPDIGTNKLTQSRVEMMKKVRG